MIRTEETARMELSRARFYRVVTEAAEEEHRRGGIGTYREKKLHLILKNCFEEDPACQEVPTAGFIADIRRGDEITEIETAGFSGLCPKLAAYLPDYRVRLVHPLAGKKYVSWIDPETAEISPRRLSPKKESAYDLLFELVRILPYVRDPGLRVLGPVLEVEEYRLADGWGRGGKRGSHRYERISADLCGIIELTTDDDYRRFIPDSLPDAFTVRAFSEAARIGERKARAVMKVMERRGVLVPLGKAGRAMLWGRA